tara:strand:+ start:520 stop:1089 length:570 start_codon:yes stop_codon:yes gene_type:complete
MSSHNKNGTRDPRDFYATPAWCTEGLYKALPDDFPRPTLDPCAGTGALCLVARCRGIEIDGALAGVARDRGAKVIKGDGLHPRWNNQHILMNPPYKDALRWVRQGVEEAETCCALLRLGFLASAKRREFWTKYPPTHLIVLSSRPSFTPDGKTDSADYMWAVWQKGCEGHSTQMKWIGKTNATLQIQML